ncbi:MAG: class I SAM-dependent methyltransferase [Acidobacteria bacterium]|nr:class I SAM-dependent methyltransferase [Acidobacteriota bacterium]
MGDLLELTGRAEATHFWFRGFRTFLAPVMQEVAGGRRDLLIVDCGCGTGYNLARLQQYGRAFAFDLTPDAMRHARAAGRPLVRADMEHIPFRSGTFDLATSFDVVQSVPDDRKALREVARVLKPGGHAILNVTALDLLRGDHSVVWGEVRRYTAAGAARLVEDAGLRPVRIRYLFASLVPLMLATRTAQKVMRLAREPQGDEDLTVPPAPINAALTWLVRGEAALSLRVPMPFGSSLLIVARKP